MPKYKIKSIIWLFTKCNFLCPCPKNFDSFFRSIYDRFVPDIFPPFSSFFFSIFSLRLTLTETRPQPQPKKELAICCFSKNKLWFRVETMIGELWFSCTPKWRLTQSEKSEVWHRIPSDAFPRSIAKLTFSIHKSVTLRLIQLVKSLETPVQLYCYPKLSLHVSSSLLYVCTVQKSQIEDSVRFGCI